MNKGLLSVALLALLTLPLVAQTVTTIQYVPDNVICTNSGQSIPFRWIPTSMRYHILLEAKYLGNPSGPMKIIDVGFSRATGFSTPGFTCTQIQLRMGHNTSFTSLYAPNLGPCPTNIIDFTGSTTTSFGYNPPTTGAFYNITGSGHQPSFLHDADFGWDGKRDICLEIRFRGAPGNLTGPVMCQSSLVRRVYSPSTTGPDYYVATSGPTGTSGIKCSVTMTPEHVLLVPDTVNLGTSAVIALGGLPAGDFYQIAASLSQGYELNLGTCSIWLLPDGLFTASIILGPPIFNNYVGSIPASGLARGVMNVPNVKQLVGICVYHAAVTFGTGGISGCTNTDGFEIVP